MRLIAMTSWHDENGYGSMTGARSIFCECQVGTKGDSWIHVGAGMFYAIGMIIIRIPVHLLPFEFKMFDVKVIHISDVSNTSFLRSCVQLLR